MRFMRRILSVLLAVLIMITPAAVIGRRAEAAGSDESFWRSLSSEFYYEQFSAVEQDLYDQLDDLCMKYLLNDEDITNLFIRIDDMNISEDSAVKVLRMFRYSNPQYFFLASSYGYNKYYAALYADPDFASGSKRASAREEIKTALKSYINTASSYSRPEEKEHAILKLMCDNITYVSGSKYNQNIYSAVLGKTVCAGYTAMFTALMNACGIECASVTGSNHAWNVINLHGFWYYVDVTGADTDQDWGPYYKRYNCNESYGTADTLFARYLPSVIYDEIESDYDYSSRYITVGGLTYFIVNDIASTGRKVYRVSGSDSAVPSTVTYNNKDYSVLRSPFSGWCSSDNAWYYYTSSGQMLTGWQQISGKWYYFESSGAMKTGWYKSGNDWYCFGESGIMITGWLGDGNDWYYFDESGAMATGWRLVGNKWYYFNSDGSMKTGWYQSGSSWYYFNGSGAMVTGWQYIGSKWYYFDSSGAMCTGWLKSGNSWYYMSSSGAMKTGWYQSGGTWYYFDGSGEMATGSRTIGGKTYNFNSSGACTNP